VESRIHLKYNKKQKKKKKIKIFRRREKTSSQLRKGVKDREDEEIGILRREKVSPLQKKNTPSPRGRKVTQRQNSFQCTGFPDREGAPPGPMKRRE